MATVKQIERYIDSFAPFDIQEDFDNAGFLVGDGECNVTRALIALDATKEVIQQAIELKAELIITHHPIIFHPLKKFDGRQPCLPVGAAWHQRNICPHQFGQGGRRRE